MNPFVIILVRPRDPNNIGACARAMANFGFNELRIVDPYAPVWQEAVSAVGAHDILKQAQLCSTLDEALADTQFSLATTALRNRVIEQSILFLPDMKDFLQKYPSRRTAIVFGNEKSGLSGPDIARCNGALNIPTTTHQPSINLAQAVLLVCYEIAKSLGLKPLRAAKQTIYPSDAQREVAVKELDALFTAAGLKEDWPQSTRQDLIRNVLSRQNLDRSALFVIKNLAEKLRRHIK